MTDTARLRALLGSPETSWLIHRLRQRLEAGRGVDGALTLRNPTEAQREAVGRLFGRVATGAAITVRLSELDAMLRRAELCDGIADAVTRISGPVINQRERRSEIEEQWSEVFDDGTRRIGNHSAFREWLDDVRATGLLRRLSRGDARIGRSLLERALAVGDRLPALGTPLAELAASATGDSHALDLGQPVGTLVMRLARVLGRNGSGEQSPERRDVWANVGVLCDELSAPVLALNLRAGRATPVGDALAMHADLGEPYRLSARQLLRQPPDFAPVVSGRTVFVCENPSVVASAANQLGTRSAPLVCVEGQVRTAAHLLLHRLAAAGARLTYHGDFDWGGVRIANVVIVRYGALPWRYSSADYRVAPAGAALRGSSASACWDPELEAAMLASGRAVYEEQVLAELLADLAQDDPSAARLGR